MLGTVSVGILRARDSWRSSRALRSMLRWSRSRPKKGKLHITSRYNRSIRVYVNPTPNRYPRASPPFLISFCFFGGRVLR